MELGKEGPNKGRVGLGMGRRESRNEIINTDFTLNFKKKKVEELLK